MPQQIFLKIKNTLHKSISFSRNQVINSVYWLRIYTLHKQCKKAYILYLYADQKKYPDSLHILKKILSRIRGYHLELITIDNFAEDKKIRQVDKNHYDIGGENSQWEFSGWQKGLDFLKNYGTDYDICVFVNDSFINYSAIGFNESWFYHAFNTLTFNMVSRNTALGRIFKSEGDHEIRYKKIPYFMQTHFFILGSDLCQSISFPFLSKDEINLTLPDKWNGEWFKNTSIINHTMMSDIINHLTRRWQFNLKPSEETWPILRGKTIAMLNERLLTETICSTGGHILNIVHGYDILRGHIRISKLEDCIK